MRSKGGAMLEVLLTVAVIGVVIFFVVLFLNRSRGVRAAHDLKRFNDVQLLLGAILRYQIDTMGEIPPEIDTDDTTWQMIGLLGQACTVKCPQQILVTDCVYLPELLPKYLEAIPVDIDYQELGSSGYYINKNQANHIITVGACNTEVQPQIELTQ